MWKIGGAPNPPSIVGSRRPIEERRQAVGPLPKFFSRAARHFSNHRRVGIVSSQYLDLVSVVAHENEVYVVGVVARNPAEPPLVNRRRCIQAPAVRDLKSRACITRPPY